MHELAVAPTLDARNQRVEETSGGDKEQERDSNMVNMN